MPDSFVLHFCQSIPLSRQNSKKGDCDWRISIDSFASCLCNHVYGNVEHIRWCTGFQGLRALQKRCKYLPCFSLEALSPYKDVTKPLTQLVGLVI